MSEAKTLFGILIVASLGLLIASDIGTTAAEKCGISSDPPSGVTDVLTTTFTNNIFVLLLTDPCVSEHSWFVWLFIIPVFITGVLVVKKLVLI